MSFVLLQGPGVGSAPGSAPRTTRQQPVSPRISRVSFKPPTRRPVERRLVAGARHIYPLPMKSGELLELIVLQEGMDLQVAVLDPAGSPLFTVDSPNDKDGPERVLLLATESALYRAEVSSRAAGEAGVYRAWIARQRRATERDRKEATAERLFHQARVATRSTEVPSWIEGRLAKAVRLWHATDKPGRQADALKLLGDFFANQSQWRKSIDVRQQAQSLYHRVGNSYYEGVLANDVGHAREEILELAAAKKSYSTALELGRRPGNARLWVTALYNLGYLSWKLGESAEALEKLEQARAAWKKMGDPQEGKALTALGVVLTHAGKPQAAMEKFQEALTIYERQKNPRQEAITLTQMGNAYVSSRYPEQARELYRKALEIQQHIPDIEDLPVTLTGLGVTLLNQNRPREALQPLLKALQIDRQNARVTDEARTLVNLGWTYAVLGQETEARRAYQKALVLAGKTQDRWMVTAARLGLAKLEEARGNPIEAHRYAKDAVASVEGLRMTASPGLRVAFLASQQDVYDALIEILLWRHRLRPSEGYDAEALKVNEQASSRGLLDGILERSSASRSNVPRILSLPEIQRSVLDQDTILLEYHLGERASSLWLVDQKSLKVFNLPPRQSIENLVETTRKLIIASFRREKQNEARRAAEKLSQILLGPATTQLGKKRLVFTLPVSLQAVPLGALPDLAVPGARKKLVWPQPLLAEHEIVEIPSASVLAALRARGAGRTPPEGLLAALGDAVFDFRDKRLAGIELASSEARSEASLDDLSGSFKRLPNTGTEIRSILAEAGRHGVLSASGFAANRAFVLRGVLRGFRNLHFATHGRLRSDDGGLSALIVSQFDPRGRPVNGYLRASEIKKLDLPADLVALSACETGLGERIRGEGLVGLPQAFFEAGATRVLVSLWAVNDLATSKLMKRFYHEYLSRGLSPAAALREVQKEMWREPARSAPFYWGAFELQGDWKPVDSLH